MHLRVCYYSLLRAIKMYAVDTFPRSSHSAVAVKRAMKQWSRALKNIGVSNHCFSSLHCFQLEIYPNHQNNYPTVNFHSKNAVSRQC